jgi:hypothetical protein
VNLLNPTLSLQDGAQACNLRDFAMAKLTTVDGIQITFVAKTVSAMADHDANTGFAVTCVYGVTKEVLQISESVQDFMKRVRITKDFAQLARPNGFPIWINGSAVSLIR